MSRQKLLALLASIAVLAVTACTDITAPTHQDTTCPISGGPDCSPH